MSILMVLGHMLLTFLSILANLAVIICLRDSKVLMKTKETKKEGCA